MTKFPNHYEILNVSKDASLEEIRSSYHTLCKLFHPDLNPQMADGLEMIEELTNSYEVLKDVNARQDYDMKYLIEMRRKSSPPAMPSAPVAAPVKLEKLPAIPAAAIKSEPPRVQLNEEIRRPMTSMNTKQSNGSSLKVAGIAAMAILGLSMIGFAVSSQSASKIGMISIKEEMARSSYVRPATAPNGQAFPETSAYISGYEVRNNEGASSLLVSNTKNDNDVYLKLISVDSNKAVAVRHVFVKAKTEFNIQNLSVGEYEIQYMDLVAGLAGKSQKFTVKETKTAIGMNTTSLSVHLQTAVNGVLRVETISVDEFNSLASL